jgi:hypothetical protein
MKKSAILVFILIVILIILVMIGWHIRNLNTSINQSPKLVVGFPDIPVYPKANLISSVSEPNADGIIYQSIWEVSESVPNISSWYIKSLEDSGWIIDVKPADLNANDIQNIISIKGDNTLNLAIIKKAEKKKVEITAEFFPEVKDEPAFQEYDERVFQEIVE